jgi:hypothetical protein
VLEASDECRGDDETDQEPHEVTKSVTVTHDSDDLANEKWLGERRSRAQNAQNDDKTEHATVLKQVGHQLAKGGLGVAGIGGASA